jgi:hypothetical protein
LAYESTGQDGCGDESDEVAWGRIYRLGPGGATGFKDPSIIHFQAGDPATGVRMEELALHGLRFTLRPAAAVPLDKGKLKSSFAAGGIVDFGYDLTRFIPLLDELWVDAEAGLLVGSDELFLPFGVHIETASYIADRLSLVGSIGAAFTIVSKSIPVGGNSSATDIALSGTAVGMNVSAGVNYSIRPEWNLRFMLEGRSGFASTTLKNERKAPGLTVDAGHVLMPMASLSVSYTY